MAWCNTPVFPVLMHWSHRSLSLSHRYGVNPKGAFALIRVRVLHRVRFLQSRSISSKVFMLGRARVRVRYFNKVHRLYMASASIRFFMKDADAVKDVDANQCKRTFSVRGPSYRGLISSILWLLMPWLLLLPGHQQPWYWLCEIGKSWYFLRKDANCLCHVNVEDWHKM